MLRPYQKGSISRLKEVIRAGHNKIVVQLPTGGGKTVIFSYLCSKIINATYRCLILTDRIELLSQTGGTLKKFNLEPTVIHGNVTAHDLLNSPLCIAMEQTLSRRLSQFQYQEFLYGFDYIFIDECHKTSFDKFFEYFNPRAKVFGLTATPIRTGKQKSLDCFYDKIVHGPQVQELIDLGFLCPSVTRVSPMDLKGIKVKKGDYDLIEMDKRFSAPQLTKGVLKNYLKYTPGTKTLIFCPGVASSIQLASEFNEAGLRANHLDGNTCKVQRKETLKGFGTDFLILTNCNILTTGFDDPSIETIILYRATKSLTLFCQMAGRGSRIYPGKEHFNLLDFGSNCLTHGRWEQTRTFTLDKKKQRLKKEKDMDPYRLCRECNAFIPQMSTVCEFCGAVRVLTEKERIEVDLAIMEPYQFKEKLKNYSHSELEHVARGMKYHANWVPRVVAGRGGLKELREFASYKNHKPGWLVKTAKRLGIFS